MAEVSEKTYVAAMSLMGERFNALVMNALVRHPSIVQFGMEAGMSPAQSVNYLFFEMVPETLKQTTLLTSEGRAAFARTLIEKLEVIEAENTPTRH